MVNKMIKSHTRLHASNSNRRDLIGGIGMDKVRVHMVFTHSEMRNVVKAKVSSQMTLTSALSSPFKSLRS